SQRQRPAGERRRRQGRSLDYLPSQAPAAAGGPGPLESHALGGLAPRQTGSSDRRGDVGSRRADHQGAGAATVKRSLCLLALLLAAQLALGSDLVVSEQSGSQQMDVLVYGGEPEAVIAAVAAAEEGSAVMLIAQATRLG